MANAERYLVDARLKDEGYRLTIINRPAEDTDFLTWWDNCDPLDLIEEILTLSGVKFPANIEVISQDWNENVGPQWRLVQEETSSEENFSHVAYQTKVPRRFEELKLILWKVLYLGQDTIRNKETWDRDSLLAYPKIEGFANKILQQGIVLSAEELALILRYTANGEQLNFKELEQAKLLIKKQLPARLKEYENNFIETD